MNNIQTDFDQQLTQSLGLDSLHLENQWRLHLHQSSVLTADQLTPTPHPITQPTPTPTPATDSTTPILISAGTLLILLPLLGIVAILVYQRRKHQQELAAQGTRNYRAPNSLAHPMPNGPYPYHPHHPPNSTNPTHFMPSGQSGSYSSLQPHHGQQLANLPPTSQTYMPFYYPGTEQPFVTPPPMPLQQQQQQPGQPPPRPIPTSTPAFQWPVEYPPPPHDEYFAANGSNGQPAPEPFGPFQERVQQSPRKQAPQE